jgi:dihydrodipicolinate synthase/N-acetylneuraminate lyase
VETEAAPSAYWPNLLFTHVRIDNPQGVSDASRSITATPERLISNPADLQPNTPWSDTRWAWTSEEALVSHTAVPRLCVATLLPFKDKQPDWAGFARCIRWMQEAAARYHVEIAFVLNADTGYIFDLTPELYGEVLRRFRAEFPEQKFIAGVTARGAENDTEFRAERYRPLLDLAQQHDNCEVMIMTSRLLNVLDPERRRDAYFQIAEFITRPALVHALEPAFVAWATPYEPWLLWQLAQHPKFVGGKVSTLDEPHFLYWAAMCRDLGLDFTPHSGDDFGICTAIKLGLPLLFGAGASAAPLICAAMDMWRDERVPEKAFPTGKGFDTRVYKVFEALQSFEDTIFRLDAKGSAAAYKHSTAHALHRLGLLDSPEAHPACRDVRGDDESARIAESMVRPLRIAERLGIPGLKPAR